MARYNKPTLGRLRKMFKLTSPYNGALAWVPILRGRKYNRATLDTLRANNAKMMIKDVRAWLVKAEKELVPKKK